MFKEKLSEIIERTDGALAAVIMGTDGIEVEKVLRPEGRELNLDVAAATFTSLVRSAQVIGREINLGQERELLVAFDHVTICARLLSRDYFVMLAVAPDGNLGRGRFELRKAELELAHEFAL
ncbi:roadblock/LC7 domain-containing protein [Pyrinomonas methylaliphatogenes]|jgi:predicted regulator of Ras-like GTPase activity (Roadblock/LC7/MglB family)|uniref:Roadblock/LAMTOR2 domain-containing protein n=1 Tax=Pyrinomonas methylaliphatogenes TaxID=454194 RepID=A0A0B6X1G5_9BACT|nr:hypothetical protein [Pyrinomonas methylaliphatogenes]MBX5480094.1 hypothetical protein [Pyrinomonas methylaliphatogenes]CDM66210.1 hypothetical protein PYK22_02224 [Pyrinomonas methylaliphatogenes]